MKKIISLLLMLAFALVVTAQSANDDVTLVVTGNGTTKESATNNALRSAISQTYALLFSADTSLLKNESTNNEINSSSIDSIKDNKYIVANDTADGGNREEIYDIAEIMPKFNGNVNQWLSANVQYPDSAAKNGIQGRVIVRFVIRKDGSVTDAQIVRSVDPILDGEALRVIKSMPKWNPGLNNGEPVSCWFSLPLTFRLERTEPSD